MGDRTMLASCWRVWAERLDALVDDEWDRPTRCGTWTVHDLAAHAAPNPEMLRALETMVTSDAPAFATGAEVPRRPCPTPSPAR